MVHKMTLEDSAIHEFDHAEVLRQLRTEWPAPSADWITLAARFERLFEAGFDTLPLPASGNTLTRWQMLADIASLDLGLAKLLEGHTDALAILSEISDPHRFASDARWATWASEPPFARLEITPSVGTTAPLTDNSGVVLNGTKAWCSGAHGVSHALVTAWFDDTPYLAAVMLAQPGVKRTHDGWHAVGMAATASVDVHFEAVDAVIVGAAEDYVRRAGFWHGGIGVAACWWGGAARLAGILLDRLTSGSDPHRLAHLGAVDVAVRNGAARLREAASWIDQHPRDDARYRALSVRAAIDDMASTVIQHCGRALGAGAYCRDPAFSRMVADLPVFVRQAHAERDLEEIGRGLLAVTGRPGSTQPIRDWRLSS